MNRIKRQYKRFRQKRYSGLFLLIAFLSVLYIFVLRDLPSPTKLDSLDNPQSSRIYDRKGELLYTIFTNENRTQIPLEEIPKEVQNATISIEDKDFYRHGAVDLRGIARAVVANASGKPTQGGSTLTQQLIKNSLLSPEQTIQRKLKEVVLAFATEILYSKPQIMEMYLNQIPYGGTAYGIEAAAQTYFGKNAKNLTLAESALLAGLPEAPSVYSPFGSRPELAEQRQKLVLQKMYEQGYISQGEMERAKNEKLVYKNISNDIKAPHFVLYVKDLLTEKYGAKFVEQGGLEVKTSLDLEIQEFAELAVASEVARLRFARVSNGAAVVTNPSNGDVLAMVGSKNYFDDTIDGNVNITLALRQPGSSIKPINYAVGLANGYTAATIFIDKQTCFPSPGQAPYCPRNYDGKFHGVVSMRDSLGNSLNIPAVKMLKLNTVPTMLATASAMGLSTLNDPSRYGLSLTLGGGEVRMIDMATAFGVFANKGYRVDINPILEIKDRTGKVIEKKENKSPIFGKKVLDEEVAFIISDILADNNARAMAFGTRSELVIPNKTVSVKTGTTNDYRDNWTIGYTPNFLVTTWVGNNDNTPMGGVVSGVTGAAPIWNEIMTYVLSDKPAPPMQKPENVVRLNVCKHSGLLPRDGVSCETRPEYFVRNKLPKRGDPGKTAVFVDKNSKDIPGDAKQTENLEPKEEYVIQDDTGDRYCVTCPKPSASPSPSPSAPPPDNKQNN
jgi:1A family penicillin-binding protein